jgi:hypothetical protein
MNQHKLELVLGFENLKLSVLKIFTKLEAQNKASTKGTFSEKWKKIVPTPTYKNTMPTMIDRFKIADIITSVLSIKNQPIN